MAKKIYTSVNTFNAGEVSDLIFNREDITKYKSSCRVLENALPLVEGGAKKMPGTYFAGSANNQNAPNRLVQFQFSTLQGAFLEFSANAIRIWQPGSDGWTLQLVGAPLVLATPYTQADLFDLDCGTQSADVLWIFHENYPPACVERLSATNWIYSLAPPGGTPNEPAYRGTSLTSVVDALGVPILQATQAFPLVIVTQSAFARGQRVYISGMAGMTELNEQEYYTIPVLNTSNNAQFTGHIDGGSSAVSGTILTVTAISSGTILVGMQIIGANVAPNTIVTALLSGSGGTGTYSVGVNQLVNASTSMAGVGGFAYNLVLADAEGVVFTGSISGTTLTVTAVQAGQIVPGVGLYYPGIPAGTAVVAQLTGTPGGVGTYSVNISQTASLQGMSNVPIISLAYQPYAGGGFAVKVGAIFNVPGEYPSCGTLYQQRLCVGGTNDKPTTMYGSVQGDFSDFIADPTLDDHAIQFTLVSNLLDQIINMIGNPNALIIGTAGGVWAMGGSNNLPLSQSNVNAAKQTTLGVSRLQPQLVGDAAIFVSRSAKQVSFLVFNFGTNTWENYDLTRLNREITIGTSLPIGYDTTCGLSGGGSVYPTGLVINTDGGMDNLVSYVGNNGTTVDLHAILIWSDGSTQDITTTATWGVTGSGVTIALVGAVERATLTNPNTFNLNAVITATSPAFAGVSQSNTLAVTVNGSGGGGPTLVDIVLNFDAGTDSITHWTGTDSDVWQVYAVGIYSDGSHANITTSVIWSSGTHITLGPIIVDVQQVTLSNTTNHSVSSYIQAQAGTIVRTMTWTISGSGGE